MNNDNKRCGQIRREFLKIGIGASTALLSGMGLHGCLPLRQRQTQTNGTRFKFAHVTDTHISTQGKNGAAMKADSIQIFEDVVSQLNETEGLDFILFGGDNFDNSEKGVADLNEVLRLTEKLKTPYYIQFGNREAASLPKDDPLSKEQFTRKFQGHGFNGDSFWWSASPLKDVTVLGLDTSIEGRNYGAISDEQLKWMKKEIAIYRNDFVIILTHHLFLPTWRPKTIPKWEKNYLIGNSVEVMPVLENAPNVKLILSGHHHATNVQIRNGLPYIATPATVQYPHAFRIISVDSSNASLEFRQIRDSSIISSGRANLIKAKSDEYGKSGDGNVADYCLGGDKDRNVQIRMNGG